MSISLLGRGEVRTCIDMWIGNSACGVGVRENRVRIGIRKR